MCKSDELLLKDLSNRTAGSTSTSPSSSGLRTSSSTTSSTSNSSDGSESDDSRDISTTDNSSIMPMTTTRTITTTSSNATTIARRRKLVQSTSIVLSPKLTDHPKPTRSSFNLSSLLSIGVSVSSGIFHSIFWIAFSLYFPFLLAPQAATQTYHKASYLYQPDVSHFDTTFWTYGTDYILAVIMTILVVSILRYSRRNVSDQLCYRTASLLILYGISVTAGGIAHQNFVTMEARNTFTFRFLWTICVGTVCAASCSMGMIGTEAIRKFQQKVHMSNRGQRIITSEDSPSSMSHLILKVPVVSDVFWVAFGGAVTVFCAVGGLSFQRPACDIFVAGITQSPSTFYCMIFFFVVHHPRIATWVKVMGLVGFILNAPLLPMYPLLVQYTDWSLASVNTLLHSWLCVAWSMQGISMQYVIQALVADAEEEEKGAVVTSIQSQPKTIHQE